MIDNIAFRYIDVYKYGTINSAISIVIKDISIQRKKEKKETNQRRNKGNQWESKTKDTFFTSFADQSINNSRKIVEFSDDNRIPRLIVCYFRQTCERNGQLYSFQCRSNGFDFMLTGYKNNLYDSVQGSCYESGLNASESTKASRSFF